MRPLLKALAANRLNLLVVAAPVSWLLHVRAPGSPWVFVAAAISLVPLAGVIGLGTEELACRSGPGVGGFLNATFGNAAELIIAVVALGDGRVALVKASITGSIVGNLLLVLGASFFAGGLGRQSQKFNRTAATNTASMLFLAVVALVMPAVFDLSLYGRLGVQSAAIDHVSLGSACVLIVAYVGSLIYAFRSHRDLFRSKESHCEASLTLAQAIGALAIGTVLTTVQAELLVGDLTPALEQLGLTERGRALLRRRGRAQRPDDARRGDLGREQRADRAPRGTGRRAVFVRDRPSHVAALQPVRDCRDRALGDRDVSRGGGRREQLGRRPAADVGLRHPRPRVLLRSIKPDRRRQKGSGGFSRRHSRKFLPSSNGKLSILFLAEAAP
jgi:hypothetical protein